MGSTFFAQVGQPIDGIFATYGQTVAGQFATNIYPFVQATLTLWLLLYALATLRGESSQPLRNAPSAWSVLDAAWDQTGALLKQIWQQAGITALDYVAAGVCLLIGAVIFMLVALVIIIISKVVTAFLVGVGPLFMLAHADEKRRHAARVGLSRFQR